MDKKTTILMTGHLGLIGKIVKPRLEALGYEVVGYDLIDGDDINDTQRLASRLKGAVACVHLAGIPGPWGKPWEDYEVSNVNGTKSVIKACLQAGVDRIVYMSSGAVYGFTRGTCRPEQFPMKESNVLPGNDGLDFYDKSKQICEKHLEKACENNPALTAIALRMDTPVPIAPVLPQHLYTSISEDNLGEAVRAAIQSKFKGFGAFNINDPEIPPISDHPQPQAWIADIYPTVPNRTKGMEPLVDISKAKKLLGFNPK